jgi:hypothetical protein
MGVKLKQSCRLHGSPCFLALHDRGVPMIYDVTQRFCETDADGDPLIT